MRTRSVLLPVLAVVAAGCTVASPASPGWSSPPQPPAASAAQMVVEVYKSPTCSCCHEWEAYLRGRGYTVRSILVDDVVAIKTEHALPPAVWSCHTAVIDGYVVEGHVPVEAIEDLLLERPAIDGIALPGMPDGSPGMGGVKAAPFEIVAVSDGRARVFGSF
jgi:hypothetical protein